VLIRADSCSNCGKRKRRSISIGRPRNVKSCSSCRNGDSSTILLRAVHVKRVADLARVAVREYRRNKQCLYNPQCCCNCAEEAGDEKNLIQRFRRMLF
jgi:hypothetical protein